MLQPAIISRLEFFMRYEVGQVIFLLNSADLKIIPARVEEEIIRRRATGEEINYKVALPTKARDVVNLSELDVEVFTSSAELRSHMVDNAVKMIDSLIDRAGKVSRIFANDLENGVREEETVVES